jgi:hypothetical protein
MAMKKTFSPPEKDCYIHKQVGSDRYCWKVELISKDGKTIKVRSVRWDGPNAWLNEGKLVVDGNLKEFVWKYNAWREYTTWESGYCTNEVITRRREFADHGSPYMDPSF